MYIYIAVARGLTHARDDPPARLRYWAFRAVLIFRYDSAMGWYELPAWKESPQSLVVNEVQSQLLRVWLLRPGRENEARCARGVHSAFFFLILALTFWELLLKHLSQKTGLEEIELLRTAWEIPHGPRYTTKLNIAKKTKVAYFRRFRLKGARCFRNHFRRKKVLPLS